MLVEQALFIINVNFSYGDAAVIHFSVCFPLNILPVTKSKIDNLPRLDIRHIFTFQKIHLLKKILDQTYSCLITHSTLLKWQEFKFYCKTYVVHNLNRILRNRLYITMQIMPWRIDILNKMTAIQLVNELPHPLLNLKIHYC